MSDAIHTLLAMLDGIAAGQPTKPPPRFRLTAAERRDVLACLETLDDDALVASVFMQSMGEAPAVVMARYCRSVAAFGFDQARSMLLAILADPSLDTERHREHALKSLANAQSYQKHAEHFAKLADGRKA